jgi:hypothetical protein
VIIFDFWLNIPITAAGGFDLLEALVLVSLPVLPGLLGPIGPFGDVPF